MIRLKGILAAAALTGVVAVTSLALGAGDMIKEFVAGPPTTVAVPTAVPAVVPAAEVQLSSEQLATREAEYKVQIEAANATIVQLQAEMQALGKNQTAREAQYQAQIEAANQMIKELQDKLTQIQSQPIVIGGGGGGGGEDGEEHDD
jgi:hypothetical protein